MNTKIKEFEQQLINLINSAELPISVIRLCLNEITAEVQRLELQIIEQEKQREQQSQSQPQKHEAEVVEEK